ncbi:MAG: hypothetical protein U5M53_08300 [Rhodoferax sp.]|nr:hypothetical protein [Rhodoferax sp.]
MPNAIPPKSSTKKVKASQFTAHGVVEIWMDGPLMHYEATGPFNVELVDCLAIAQRDYLLASRPSGAWVSVCTVRRNAMASPDSIARYAAIMAAPKPDNMVPCATAFVIAPEVEGGAIMAPHFTKIYDDIGRPFQVFDNLAAAQVWANSWLSRCDGSKP